jgi:hypothetical protein
MAKKPEDRIQTIGEFLSIYEKIEIFRPGKRPPGFRRFAATD